jgi:outer membrane lipoprotein SlyB
MSIATTALPLPRAYIISVVLGANEIILLTLVGIATTRPALSVTDATATAVGAVVGAMVGATVAAIVASGTLVAVGAWAGAVAQALRSTATVNRTTRKNDFMEFPFK